MSGSISASDTAERGRHCTREFAMSESTLLRQLKRLTGLSPVQYLLDVRLTEARRLLEEPGLQCRSRR
jgi:transcriptional regulator GlxA family with amidase domain